MFLPVERAMTEPTPTSPPEGDPTRLEIAPGLAIPLTEFGVEYIRSGGPGGQNVNKVASKARVRWHVTASPSLPEGVRERFVTRFKSRLTDAGELVIAGQTFRDQRKNYQDCLNRVRAMVLQVLVPPTPRRPTRPTAGSHRRRLASKKQRAEKKARRGKPGGGEW